MSDFRFFGRKELWLFALVSVLAALSFLGSVLLAFADDGRTPWFSAGAPAASSAAHCADRLASSERHRCLRKVATAATGPARPALAMATK